MIIKLSDFGSNFPDLPSLKVVIPVKHSSKTKNILHLTRVSLLGRRPAIVAGRQGAEAANVAG